MKLQHECGIVITAELDRIELERLARQAAACPHCSLPPYLPEES